MAQGTPGQLATTLSAVSFGVGSAEPLDPSARAAGPPLESFLILHVCAASLALGAHLDVLYMRGSVQDPVAAGGGAEGRVAVILNDTRLPGWVRWVVAVLRWLLSPYDVLAGLTSTQVAPNPFSDGPTPPRAPTDGPRSGTASGLSSTIEMFRGFQLAPSALTRPPDPARYLSTATTTTTTEAHSSSSTSVSCHSTRDPVTFWRRWCQSLASQFVGAGSGGDDSGGTALPPAGHVVADLLLCAVDQRDPLFQHAFTQLLEHVVRLAQKPIVGTEREKLLVKLYPAACGPSAVPLARPLSGYAVGRPVPPTGSPRSVWGDLEHSFFSSSPFLPIHASAARASRPELALLRSSSGGLGAVSPIRLWLSVLGRTIDATPDCAALTSPASSSASGSAPVALCTLGTLLQRWLRNDPEAAPWDLGDLPAYFRRLHDPLLRDPDPQYRWNHVAARRLDVVCSEAGPGRRIVVLSQDARTQSGPPQHHSSVQVQSHVRPPSQSRSCSRPRSQSQLQRWRGEPKHGDDRTQPVVFPHRSSRSPLDLFFKPQDAMYEDLSRRIQDILEETTTAAPTEADQILQTPHHTPLDRPAKRTPATPGRPGPASPARHHHAATQTTLAPGSARASVVPRPPSQVAAPPNPVAVKPTEPPVLPHPLPPTTSSAAVTKLPGAVPSPLTDPGFVTASDNLGYNPASSLWPDRPLLTASHVVGPASAKECPRGPRTNWRAQLTYEVLEEHQAFMDPTRRPASTTSSGPGSLSTQGLEDCYTAPQLGYLLDHSLADIRKSYFGYAHTLPMASSGLTQIRFN